MPHQFSSSFAVRLTLAFTVVLTALGLSGLSNAQPSETTSAGPAAPASAPNSGQRKPALGPSPTAASAQELKQRFNEYTRRREAAEAAFQASIPQGVDKQHEEIVRIFNTPSPSAEDRELLVRGLLGQDFPRGHPLRANEAWWLAYLRGRSAPDAQEQEAFLSTLKARMLFVPGGTFMMGDFGILTKYKEPINGTKDTPPHKVTLDSYSLMRSRVTYREYDFYTRITGQPPIGTEDVLVFARFPDYTVRPTLWAQADGYCHWLADFTKLPFALPTEAQWEYAARERGQFVAYPGHHMPGLRWANEYIPYWESLDDELVKLKARSGRKTIFIDPRPAGRYGANRIGMEDVIGGSWEWVADWYDADYYKMSPVKNPKGPVAGTKRVVRPSAYGDYRSVIVRRSELPDQVGEYMEFRCALNRAAAWK